MRPLIASCIALALSQTAVAAHSELSRDALAIIRRLDSAYVQAWLANDRPAVLSLFSDDAVIVPQNHEPITGLSDIAKFWWPVGSSTTVTSFHSTIAEAGGSGDFGFSRGTYDFTFEYKAGGQVQKLANRGNYLMLFRRTKETWKITHRMWSDLPRR